jgi:hypothetical protein
MVTDGGNVSQADHDVDRLAGPGAVLGDPALAAMQLDQAIDQRQSPACLIVSVRLTPDRPTPAVVMHLDPEITASKRDIEPSDPLAMAERVSDQLGDQKGGKVSVLTQAPVAHGLACLVPGMANLCGVTAKLA